MKEKTLSEVLKKYLVTLKDDEEIPKLTEFDLLTIDDKIDKTIENYQEDFLNMLYFKYLMFRKNDIKPSIKTREVIFNGRSYISRSCLSINDCSGIFYSKNSNFTGGCYTALIKPLGDLSSCIIIDLLEDYFNKDIFSFGNKERDEIRNNLLNISFKIPKFILSEYEKFYVNQEFFIYYPWLSFKKDWKIIKAKIKNIDECYNLIDVKTGKTIFLGDISYTRDKWLIALDKEMLKNQIESIKKERLNFLSERIIKLEKKIPVLEKKIEDTRIEIENCIDSIILDEIKLDKILKDGETA